MTKAQIVREIVEENAERIKAPFNKKKYYKKLSGVVERFFSGVIYCLTMGEKVVIPGFGTFKIVGLSERRSYDINTKKFVILPARKIVKFIPSEVLLDSIR